MTKFSFDYKDYHIIVNSVVDNIIKAYCDSENDKSLLRIDYREEFEDKDKLIELIKLCLDGRIQRKTYKNILTGTLALKCLRSFNKTGDKETYYKAIERDLEVLEILREKINFKGNEKWFEYYLSTDNVDDSYITLQLNENGNHDNFYKIKEWLNSDK